MGDGALGEGVIYEAFNMSALWSTPILYVLENNHIAQTTPLELALAGKIAARFEAFGIPTQELDSSDVAEILPVAGELLEQVRSKAAPRALVLHTCRFGPHSKGDDTRPEEQVQRLRQERDPVSIQAARLKKEERDVIEREVEAEVAQAFELASNDPVYEPVEASR